MPRCEPGQPAGKPGPALMPRLRCWCLSASGPWGRVLPSPTMTSPSWGSVITATSCSMRGFPCGSCASSTRLTWPAEAMQCRTRVVRRILGITGAGLAFGVGCHLLLDVCQPKAVIFPFFGFLVEGSLVDDNLWLLGNAVWCFKDQP